LSSQQPWTTTGTPPGLCARFVPLSGGVTAPPPPGWLPSSAAAPPSPESRPAPRPPVPPGCPEDPLDRFECCPAVRALLARDDCHRRFADRAEQLHRHHRNVGLSLLIHRL